MTENLHMPEGNGGTTENPLGGLGMGGGTSDSEATPEIVAPAEAMGGLPGPADNPLTHLEVIFPTIASRMEGMSDEDKASYKEGLVASLDKDKPVDDLVRALRQVSLPEETPDEVIDSMLQTLGHSDEAKRREILDRKEEWVTKKEERPREEEDPEETAEQREAKRKAADEVEEAVKDMKHLIDKGHLDRLTDEEFLQAKMLEENARGKIATWLDMNPGFATRANRLVVRPGIAIILFTAVLYMSILSALTKNAAQKR
jgi:hypothetical protein